MHFLLLFSRQGRLRLQKWFTPTPEREKKKIIRDMTAMVLARKPKTCNFLHWMDLKVVYKRCVFPPINNRVQMLTNQRMRLFAHQRGKPIYRPANGLSM